ncbi:MAG TPA: TrkH family potassium uptake protein [Acidimicrobiia bacterium]|nr:TrkH family potassium uptake protein [Acidimicrobiia bacterium]
MTATRSNRRQRDTSASAMVRRLSFIGGRVVAGSGIAMLPAAFVSVIYGEASTALAIAAAGVITIIAGTLGWRLIGTQGVLTTKEGFGAVGLAWFVMSAFGTLPYLLSGAIPGITDAFFETASGFTTTGASILPEPGVLPHGILFWRSTTQWVGGMGIIILSIAVLPLLGVGGVQLARAESPGPVPDRLTPRFQETAKRLWFVYVGLTAIQALLLWAGDMTLFQAVNHAFTTLSTGGFGTEHTSITGFSAYTQWVIIGFMFLAGASFALHYRALRQPGVYLKSVEFGLYSIIVLVAIVIIAGGLLGPGVEVGSAIRDATFTAVSIITTTGYATADFGSWRPALQIFVVGLMFLGGMAGSTAGGVKTFRVGILSKAAAADLRRLVHPRGVFITRFGKDRVRDEIVESVQSFFLFYMFLFMTGTFLLSFLDANASERLDLITTASAVAASLGNIGPGLGEVGPTAHYAGLPGTGKWLLSGLMIVGRLEIFPVLLLFTRDLWRR